MSGQGGNLWRTLYSVDFTSLTTQNLKTGGDVAKTIDGKTWLLTNSASATSIDLINGTGIVIVCNTVSSSYTGSPLRNLPILACLLSGATTLGASGSIFGTLRDYCIPSHIVRVMFRVLLTNADADFEGAVVGIEDAAAPTNQAFTMFKGRSAGNALVASSVISTTPSTVVSTTFSFTDDVLGFMFEPSVGVEAWTGVYDSTAGRLPYSFSNFRGAERQNMSLPLMRSQGEPRIFMGAQSGNTSGTITATYTHLRVDVASKSPPR